MKLWSAGKCLRAMNRTTGEMVTFDWSDVTGMSEGFLVYPGKDTEDQVYLAFSEWRFFHEYEEW